jgi:hypothetical protein
VSSIEEYNKDTWNNLDKYIKRKHNTRIDDRIARARKKLRLQVSMVNNAMAIRTLKLKPWIKNKAKSQHQLVCRYSAPADPWCRESL